jgi:hypothetical protein
MRHWRAEGSERLVRRLAWDARQEAPGGALPQREQEGKTLLGDDGVRHGVPRVRVELNVGQDDVDGVRGANEVDVCCATHRARSTVAPHHVAADGLLDAGGVP